MKEWNKPKVWVLGVENTNEDLVVFDPNDAGTLGMGEDHYCHKTGQMETHVDNKHTGHFRSEKCSGVHWTGPHDSKCCCGS